MSEAIPDRHHASTPRLSLGARFVVSLSLLLSVAAVAIGGVYYYKNAEGEQDAVYRQRMTATIDRLDAQLTSLSEQKTAMSQRIEAIDEQTQQFGSAAKNTASALEAEVDRRLAAVRSEMGVEIQKVTENAAEVALLVELLEVRYLLRAATLRLRLRNDIAGAAQLVEDALLRLRERTDLLVLPLKAQLEDDLITLQQMNFVDAQSLLAQLQEIEQRVPQTRRTLAVSPPHQQAATADSFWQQLLESAGQLVQVRNLELQDLADFDAGAYLNDAEESLIRVTFDVAMMQARTALLMRDTEGFREQLLRIAEWHNKFSHADAAATMANEAALDELSKLDLAATRFELTEALRLLDQLLVGQI